SKTIKEAGYDSFYEMVNTYRIKEFIYIIEHQKIKGIHETFFDVGFRSKATAIRNFRQQTGTTPSEYLQQILLDKE
ncbi:MAG: helix-turn-helix domain-containing protein, partial [Bacteroides sp.]